MDDFEDDFEDDFDWDAAFGDNKSNDSSDAPGPCKKRKVDKRKFPGPAGILPQIRVDAQNNHQLAKIKDKREHDQILLENITNGDHDLILTREELIENNEAWNEILKQTDLNESRMKYNTEYMKKEVTEGMALKVPIFCAVLKSVDITSGLDMACELMDDKGEISGALHR